MEIISEIRLNEQDIRTAIENYIASATGQQFALGESRVSGNLQNVKVELGNPAVNTSNEPTNTITA